MRGMALALLLVATAWSGCVSDDLTGDEDAPAPNVAFDRVFRFTAEGMALDAPTQSGVPVWVLTGGRGGEPTMGIPSTGSVFAVANNEMQKSVDRGATWEVVQEHSGQNFDPMMWVDPWTDWVYNAPMSIALACASIYRSGDDGETWESVPLPNCGRNVYDHQKLASGPLGPDTPDLPIMSHPTVLYMCYNGVTAAQCAVSFDNGDTWPIDNPAMVHTPATSTCTSGGGGHPTVSHQGIVAMAKTDGCSTPHLVYSTDSGFTWHVVAGPTGVGSRELDPEVAFTPDGTLYFLFRGDDELPYLGRSTDLGATWDGPWRVAPEGVLSATFLALGAGDDGRIALSFIGTRDTDAGTDAAPPETRWHLWMVTSDDAAAAVPTFTAYQATPDEDPVQVGSICMEGIFCTGGNRNLLDFIDGAVHPDGTWFTTYTDGCTVGCAANADAEPGDSRSSDNAVARLDGWSLFAPSADAMDAP